MQGQFPHLGSFFSPHNRSLRDPRCEFTFKVNNSRGRQSKALERSVNSVPNAWLLSTACFHFSSITNRQRTIQNTLPKTALIFQKKFIHKQSLLLAYQVVFQMF